MLLPSGAVDGGDVPYLGQARNRNVHIQASEGVARGRRGSNVVVRLRTVENGRLPPGGDAVDGVESCSESNLYVLMTLAAGWLEGDAVVLVAEDEVTVVPALEAQGADGDGHLGEGAVEEAHGENCVSDGEGVDRGEGGQPSAAQQGLGLEDARLMKG